MNDWIYVLIAVPFASAVFAYMIKGGIFIGVLLCIISIFFAFKNAPGNYNNEKPVGKAEVHNHDPSEPISLGSETHRKYPGIDESWEKTRKSKSEEK